MNECFDLMIKAAKGTITKEKAIDIFGRMERQARERAQAKAISETAALNEIAGEFKVLENLKIAKAEQQRLLGMVVDNELYNYAHKFRKAGSTFGAALQAAMVSSHKRVAGARASLDNKIQSLSGQWVGKLFDKLDAEELLEEFLSNRLSREINLEAWQIGRKDGKPGISGSEKARRIAEIEDEVRAETVARANSSGASIGREPGYSAQSHDGNLVRRAGGANKFGRKEDKELSFQAWRATIDTSRIDAERTFKGEDPEKWLRKMHDHIYTGVYRDSESGGANKLGNLADRMSHSKSLYWKDPEAQWEYHQLWGVKDRAASTISEFQQRARNVAVMETLGVVPEETWHRVKQRLLADVESGELSDAHTQKKSLDGIDKDFRVVTGLNDISINPTLTNITGNALSITRMGKLGNVIISALGDTVFLNHGLATTGMGRLEALGKQIIFLGSKSPDEKKFLRSIAAISDGATGEALRRIMHEGNPTGLIKKFERWFFKGTMLGFWTETWKSVSALSRANLLGQHADVEFGALTRDLQDSLDAYGIGPDEWDVYRKAKWNEGDHDYITSDRLDLVSDEDIAAYATKIGKNPSPATVARVRQNLTDRLGMYFIDQGNIDIPTPTAAERSLLVQNTQAGSWERSLLSILTIFKSFPVAVMNKVLAREVFRGGDMTASQFLRNSMHNGKSYANIGSLFSFLTIMGYVSWTAKEALRGRTAPPLVDEDGNVNIKTLKGAAWRGGALGLMGDVLFAEYDGFGRTLSRSMQGPLVSSFDEVAGIADAAQSGKNVGARTFRFARDNAPFVNLHLIRPTLDYLFFWNLEEQLTPGSLENYEESVEKRGQEFYIRPTERVK